MDEKIIFLRGDVGIFGFKLWVFFGFYNDVIWFDLIDYINYGNLLLGLLLGYFRWEN